MATGTRLVWALPADYMVRWEVSQQLEGGRRSDFVQFGTSVRSMGPENDDFACLIDSQPASIAHPRLQAELGASHAPQTTHARRGGRRSVGRRPTVAPTAALRAPSRPPDPQQSASSAWRSVGSVAIAAQGLPPKSSLQQSPPSATPQRATQRRAAPRAAVLAPQLAPAAVARPPGRPSSLQQRCRVNHTV